MLSENINRNLSAVMLLIIGVFISMAAAGIIPVDQASLHAPAWVIMMTGLLCIMSGLAIIFKNNRPLSNFLAGTVMTLFSIVFTWASIFAKKWDFSGVPLLPASAARLTGYIFTGALSLLCWLLSAAIWRSFIRSPGKDKRPSDSSRPS